MVELGFVVINIQAQTVDFLKSLYVVKLRLILNFQ